MSTILSLILFIVSLGALIVIHELGHLSMAKLFKVYCKEFSVGFGPALLHKRKEGKETYFSIRAIPLGGYVSMYGEEDLEEDSDLHVPPERSLEGIKKWKKAIVISAGVILNAVLALILIGVSNIAFPLTRQTRNLIVEESSVAYNAGFKNNDKINYLYPSEYFVDGGIYSFYYEYTDDNGKVHSNSFFIVDNDVTINVNGEEKHLILTYTPLGNKGDQVVANGLSLYYAVSGDKIDVRNVPDEELRNSFINWYAEGTGPQYYPNISTGIYPLTENTKITCKIPVNSSENDELSFKTVELETVKNKKDFVFKDFGLKMAVVDEWLPFNTRIKNTFIEYGDSAVAVFKGIGMLFKTGIKNMSGIVGIYSMSSSILQQYTFATYLSLWGLISVNLAIFNLLPFPGLDGWQLLVTAVEGITKKKIPNKFKAIMSFIGLALLLTLMIAILVLDIIAL